MNSEEKQICNERDFLYNFLKKKFPKSRNEDIEDVVQIVMLKAIRNQAQRDKKYPIRTWVATIALNSYYDLFRKSYTKNEIVGNSSSEENDYIFQNIVQDDFSEMFCQNVHNIHLCKILMLDLENNNHVQAFLMSCIDEMDYKDIAIKLNIPLGTAKSRIFRGKKLLQQKYAHLNLAYQD